MREQATRNAETTMPQPTTGEAVATGTRDDGFSSTVDENHLGGRPSVPDSEEAVAEVLGVAQSTLNLAKHHVAAIEKYPTLGAPEASQRQVLALGRILDELPPGEGVILLDELQDMGLPWAKLAAAIERVAAWSPAQWQERYRLAQAETQRERSRAITLATASGPVPCAAARPGLPACSCWAARRWRSLSLPRAASEAASHSCNN
jgi:hypothetical protein